MVVDVKICRVGSSSELHHAYENDLFDQNELPRGRRDLWLVRTRSLEVGPLW